MLVNAYFKSIFGYGQLTWMFCSRKVNAKINNLHLRALRIVYRNYTATLDDLKLTVPALRRPSAIKIFFCVN